MGEVPWIHIKVVCIFCLQADEHRKQPFTDQGGGWRDVWAGAGGVRVHRLAAAGGGDGNTGRGGAAGTAAPRARHRPARWAYCSRGNGVQKMHSNLTCWASFGLKVTLERIVFHLILWLRHGPSHFRPGSVVNRVTEWNTGNPRRPTTPLTTSTSSTSHICRSLSQLKAHLAAGGSPCWHKLVNVKRALTAVCSHLCFTLRFSFFPTAWHQIWFTGHSVADGIFMGGVTWFCC